MAAAAGKKVITVSCWHTGPFRLAIRSAFPLDANTAENIAEEVADFFRNNTLNAVAQYPKDYRTNMGSITGAAITGAKGIVTAFKLWKLFQEWLEQYSDNYRREKFLPSIVVRIEILEDRRQSNHETLEDVRAVCQIIAFLKELNLFLLKLHPACRFEYLIISPKGKRKCFSIYMPDNLLTNLNIMNVIKKISKDKSGICCSIQLNKPKWSWVKIIHNENHETITPSYFSYHQENCELKNPYHQDTLEVANTPDTLPKIEPLG